MKPAFIPGVNAERDEARRLAHALKGSSGSLGATEGQRLAAELEAALAVSNVQADDLFAEHAALLRAAGPLGEELERQVEDFLYPEALETLQRVKTQLLAQT